MGGSQNSINGQPFGSANSINPFVSQQFAGSAALAQFFN
jgi:hypothetical protein